MSLLLALLALPAHAELPACQFDRSTPESLWLVNFSPGDDLTSLFGHTLLLDYDPALLGRSATYDFGHFDPTAPGFIQNFLANRQDYTLEQEDLRFTEYVYGLDERVAVAQRLDLTPRQHRQVVLELRRRIREEGGVFRYHWYAANCTTKARDVLADVLGPAFAAQHQVPSGSSPRREVLRHSANHPLWFGLHWGSGARADEENSRWDHMFLPQNLLEGMRLTRIDDKPLIAEECLLLDGPSPFAAPEPPERDGPMALLGLGLAAGMGALFRTRRRTALALTAAWGGFVGVLGTAALLVGVLGTFAPFWGAHGLALASPLHLLLVPAALAARRGKAPSTLTRLTAVLVGGGWAFALVSALVTGGANHDLGLIALFGVNAVVAVALAWAPPNRR